MEIYGNIKTGYMGNIWETYGIYLVRILDYMRYMGHILEKNRDIIYIYIYVWEISEKHMGYM